MPQRSYGRLCALSRALELVGDRWTLVILRQLLVGPKRYTDLQVSLPHLSTNLLAGRLKRLEGDGLVARRELPPPVATPVYELTEFGAGIEPVVLELLRWGSALLADPDRLSEPADPDWPLFPLKWLAQRTPAAPIIVKITIGDAPPLAIAIAGTSANLRFEHASPADCLVKARTATDLGNVLGGHTSLSQAVIDGGVTVGGDTTWLANALDRAYNRTG